MIIRSYIIELYIISIEINSIPITIHGAGKYEEELILLETFERDTLRLCAYIIQIIVYKIDY